MMQVNEAFSVRKIEGSIRASTSVMKDVNSLIRLPELTGTMRELSMELVKAGIIEEMLDDTLPAEQEFDMDEEVEGEVDKVLGEIMAGKLQKTGEVPSAPLTEPEPEPEPEQMEEDEAGLEDMRQRLAILKS